MNTLVKKDDNTLSDKIGTGILAFISFLPLIGYGNYIRFLGVLCLLFFQLTKKKIKFPKILQVLVALMISGLCLSFITVYMIEKSINSYLWEHEAIRIIFLCIVIILIYNYKISYDYMYKICATILVLNFIIQIMQWKSIGDINNWILKYYVLSDTKSIHLSLATYKGSGFRAGSIFLNPNICMVIPCISLCVFIQNNNYKEFYWNFPLILISLFSCILTGSRTAFILSMIIICYYLFNNNIKTGIKWLLLLGLLIMAIININLIMSFRSLDIGSAMEGSGNVKLYSLLNYISFTNPIYLLTGCCGTNYRWVIDNEWGYLIMFYGVWGILWYTILIYCIKRNKKLLPIQTVSIIISMCLISCTATIVFCMQICTYCLTIALVKYKEKEYN